APPPKRFHQASVQLVGKTAVARRSGRLHFPAGDVVDERRIVFERIEQLRQVHGASWLQAPLYHETGSALMSPNPLQTRKRVRSDMYSWTAGEILQASMGNTRLVSSTHHSPVQIIP